MKTLSDCVRKFVFAVAVGVSTCLLFAHTNPNCPNCNPTTDQSFWQLVQTLWSAATCSPENNVVWPDCPCLWYTAYTPTKLTCQGTGNYYECVVEPAPGTPLLAQDYRWCPISGTIPIGNPYWSGNRQCYQDYEWPCGTPRS